MKKLLFILATLISFVAAAQPGPVNAYKTRVRYWQVMSDSLQGLPNDTFNLRTPRAISYGWNNYEWLARKNNVTYAWNVARQVWEPQVSSVSTVSIINDSTLQICNNNSCDTFSVNINPATITNVSIINDSTLLVCNVNSCDTQIFHTTGPPITTTTILNDSTIIVCNANNCDTLVVHTTVVNNITSTTILNDSTIVVCNVNSCDTLTINNITPPITTTTILNDSTIIVCSNAGCDTLIIHEPVQTTTVINDSTIQVCTNQSCDTIIIHPPITSTTIINDSTIQICNSSGTCDTVTFSSQITNISIINDTTVQVCGSNILGPEQIVNGGFIGSAGGWELGSLWAYDANDIVHSFGSTQPTAQSGGLVEGGTYKVTADIGGANGTVAIHLDAGTSQTYNAGAGTVTFTGVWNTANNYKIVLTPSNDFDGSVTNVSVRQILPNCDTIQTVPTIFRDTVHIFVESPLHARNDSTFYITRSTKQDSGFLSNDDFAYFWHKVDSLYYHPSPLGEDSFFYNNGDTTGVLWYVNDVVANGIISGGQVVYSGTPYVYNITPAVYRINGIRYTSPATQVTIDSANPTLPRTDVFYVDSSGHAAYLAGIASAIPLKPQVDQTWQIELTSLDIPVNGTPGLDTTMIYNENAAWPVEWTPVTNLGTTTNPNNISTSWVGAKSVDVTNWNNSDYVQFTAGAPVDLSTKVSIVGYIKLKQSIPSATTIRLLFVNGAVIVSSAVVITVNPSDITNWQAFSLPLSTFTFTNQSVTGVRITYVRPSSGAVHAGVFLDYIYLQSGIQATPNSNNALINVFRRPGTDSVMGTYQNGTVSYQFKDSTGAAGTVITADNGLSKNTPSNVQLGGPVGTPSPLLHDTYIENGVFSLNLKTTTGSVGNDFAPLIVSFNGTNNATAGGIVSAGSFTSSSAILNAGAINAAVSGMVNGANSIQYGGLFQNFGNSTEGDGGYLSGDAGVFGYGGATGVWGHGGIIGVKATNAGGESGTGLPLYAIISGPVPNGIHEVASFGFQSPALLGNFAANGLGLSVSFRIPTTTQSGGVVATPISNEIISQWTTAANATRISQLSITGVNSATTNTLVTIGGDGKVTITTNGTGAHSALLAKALNGGIAVTGNNGTTGGWFTGTGFGVEGGSGSGIPVLATNSGSSTTSYPALRIQNSANSPTVNDLVWIDAFSNITGGTGQAKAGSFGYKMLNVTSGSTASEFFVNTNNGTDTGVTEVVAFGTGGYMRLKPITATAASAITPAEGMVVMVSSTDATFTSIGFWGYQNGAWHAF